MKKFKNIVHQEVKFNYLYKMGKEEFITPSFRLADFRNEGDVLYVLKEGDPTRYILGENE
jgi:hypothetical protein